MSEPLGSPRASRVMDIPEGPINFCIYIAVASPSRLGLVAMMISSTFPFCNLEISSRNFKSFGPMPLTGEIIQCSTWYWPE